MFVVEDGAVVARSADGRESWRNAVAPDAGMEVFGPVLLGESVFYCARSFVWESDAASGVVERRHMLGGQCKQLAVDGDKVRVEVETAGDIRRREELISPGQAVVLRFSDGNMGALLLRTQATRILYARVPGYADAAPDAQPAILALPQNAESVDQAVLELEHRAHQDPTNPWFSTMQAVALQARGRSDAGALAALKELDAAYHHDLVATSMPLDAVHPLLAGQLFDLGLKHALEQGYEPEMAGSLTHVMGYFGTPGALALDLTLPRDLATLDRISERLYAYAPNAQAIAMLYAGVAEAHRASGNPTRAAAWAVRAEDDRPRSFFGTPSSIASRAAVSQVFLLAVLFVLSLALIIKTARPLGVRFVGDASAVVRFNPASRWTRGELVGLLLLSALVPPLLCGVDAGTRIVAMQGDAPPLFANGELGSRGALAFVADGSTTPGGALIVGMHEHRAGLVDQARASYRASGLPAAKNNLGVLEAERGRDDAARALWEEVASVVPEAAHNLGRASTGARVERAVRLGVTRPLLAVPQPAEWDGFWDAKLARASASPRMFFWWLFPTVDSDGKWTPSILTFFVLAALLVALLSVVALVTARAPPLDCGPGGGWPIGHWDRGVLGPLRTAVVTGGYWGLLAIRGSAWTIGHLVPGMARQWGVFGAPYAVAVMAAIVGSIVMENGAGPALANNLATSGLALYYGVSAPLELSPFDLWRALWFVGILVSAGLEWWRPDPLRRVEET